MALDLTLGSLVRVSSGGLCILLGTYILLQRPRSARSTWLGAFLAVVGPVFILINLARPDPDLVLPALYLSVAAQLGATFAIVMLGRSEVRTARERIAAGLLGLVCAVATVGTGILVGTPASAYGILAEGESYDRAVSLYHAARWVSTSAQLGLLAGLVLVARGRPAGRDTDLLVLVAGLGLFVVFGVGREVANPRLAVGGLLGGLAFGLIALLAALQGGRWVGVALAFAALLFTGALSNAIPGFDDASFAGSGVLRIVGLAVISYGIFRKDLLGLAIGARAMRRGTLASGALATLFIVAQLAQNYLSATYGLLLGGVIAGAFLFAASPLQRALDGQRDARASTADDAHAERVYLDALRIAYHDRAITRDEELHLAELGERLGISARRALELRHRVQTERK